ncbi:hypothetical protein [Streptomyces daghestanicus]|uniref:Integral membrane protein n=1 Tax=Streptomyces daghestanicus TaxID=66885 RepID=A0ABQ3PTQ4_9ACTN|nr:hypothetical protein [Streptomyces daghestanicus]GGU53798.1 hypothetical protein GCM10010259_51360 [Streptomyces daghestanicus]GHI28405.1 hypothetical protein Sdagh_01350 [Streptomyces daghestanicus]
MYAVLLLVLVAAVTGVVLGRAARRRPRPPEPAPAAPPRPPAAGLRTLAWWTGAAAVLLYLWGLLHLAFAVLAAEDGGTGSAPLRPCRAAAHPERAERVTGYSVSYLPLRFRCETPDGDGYPSDAVPGYVTSGAAVLALACAASAVTAGYATGRTARVRT